MQVDGALRPALLLLIDAFRAWGAMAAAVLLDLASLVGGGAAGRRADIRRGARAKVGEGESWVRERGRELGEGESWVRGEGDIRRGARAKVRIMGELMPLDCELWVN